jgi:hypothetical protein
MGGTDEYSRILDRCGFQRPPKLASARFREKPVFEGLLRCQRGHASEPIYEQADIAPAIEDGARRKIGIQP